MHVIDLRISPLNRHLIALWALCTSIAPPAIAEVTEHVSTVTYPVSVDARGLAYALNAATPIRHKGKPFHGYTAAKIAWRYRWQQGADGRCRIERVTVDLNVQITLPELTDASAAERRRFEPYLRALDHHEQGHYRIAREAAETVEARIARLPATTNCPALEASANRAGRDTLSEAEKRQADYDRITQHGKTQGAWIER